jgi:hypothetical protein
MQFLCFLPVLGLMLDKLTTISVKPFLGGSKSRRTNSRNS